MNPKRVILVVVIFLTIIGLGVKQFNLLLVQKVDVQLSNINCTTESKIKEELVLDNKNIFMIDEEKIRNDLIKKNLCVRQVKIEKKIPYSVKLVVDGRTPLVRLATFTPAQVLDLGSLEATPSSQAALLDWSFPAVSSKSFPLADETGFVFDEGEEADLPELFLITTEFFLGQQLDRENFKKIELVIKKLTGLEKPLTRAKIDGSNLLVQANQKIVFSLNRDLFGQLGSLQLILQKAKIDDGVMETIDLRFDRPVIVYSSSKKP